MRDLCLRDNVNYSASHECCYERERLSSWTKLVAGQRLYFGSRFPSELTLQYSLDLETDEKMREVIRTELAGSTVLAVAHRICESSIKVIL